MEQGEFGFKRTLEVLSENDLGIVGHIENGSSRILYKEIRGIKIAIAGFSNVDLHKIRNNNNFAVLNEENVLNALDIMKQQDADIKILCLHWGNEYIHFPSLEQRKMAYKFIDAGATIIAGHHPHVIQPYEKYNDGHIFYSLGNFMFDYLSSKVVTNGMTANLTFQKNKKVDIELHGVVLSYKFLTRKMNQAKFKKFYSIINNKYDKLSKGPDNEYVQKYLKELKKNHLIQRISMKTHILKEIFIIRWGAKFHLIKNIFSYFIKKVLSFNNKQY